MPPGALLRSRFSSHTPDTSIGARADTALAVTSATAALSTSAVTSSRTDRIGLLRSSQAHLSVSLGPRRSMTPEM